MDEKIIGINIINYDTIPRGFDTSKYGRHLSTTTTINSNKIGDQYSVLYTKSEFMEIDPARFVASVINVFKKNIPNAKLVFILEILKTKSEELGDVELLDRMTEIAKLFKDVIISGRVENVEFVSGDDFTEDVDYLSNYDSEEYDDEEDEYEDDEEEEDSLERIMGAYGVKTKDKSKKEYYGRSRVFKDSKNPKKEFHRHGVIVADSKSDVEKDLKTIKEFLKDFIPGKQSWKKEIRKELAQRWVRLYTVTKKQLKSLEHDARKNVSNKRKSKTTKQALKFTKKLFTVPIDSWSDPNK